MRKAAARRNIHHLFAGGSLQQVAPRAIEADVTEHRLRRFANKTHELPLQGARGDARDLSEFRDPPLMADIGVHHIQRAANAARQERRGRHLSLARSHSVGLRLH